MLSCFFFLFLLIILLAAFVEPSVLKHARNVLPYAHDEVVQRKASSAFMTGPMLKLRAGSILDFNLNRVSSVSGTGNQRPDVEVLVSTVLGSTFLDKKKKLVISKNGTVLDVKAQLSSKFPGSPPVELQHLYYMSKLLQDHEVISNISTLSPVPLTLDLISGTSVYNRTLSISRALDAYSATVTQQAFLAAQLKDIMVGNSRAESGLSGLNNNSSEVGQDLLDAVSGALERPLETAKYAELYRKINDSVFQQYAADIAAALADEEDPETVTPETAAWRTWGAAGAGAGDTGGVGGDISSEDGRYISPIAAAMAKEFDLNWRGVRQMAYYSVVLAVRLRLLYFACYGPCLSKIIVQIICLK
jgi:hypothetical protein